MGYGLQPDYWKMGYMSEAIEEIIKFAKNVMEVKTIKLCIAEGNVASIDLAKRFDFKLTDEIKYEDFKGKKYLHHIYAHYQ